MEVVAENWILNTFNVINLMVCSMTILCWLLWRRFAMNIDNLETEPNTRVRQSSGITMNAFSRKDTRGQVGPVQNSADGNVVESSRAGEIYQQEPRGKQEIVQNRRNNGQNQTKTRDINHENRPELRFRSGKVAARKPQVFSESMNIDEWIESLKANLAGGNSNAATDQVLISQVKSFFSVTALKRVKHIF